MSQIPFGVSLAEAIVQDLIGPVIIRQRNIGGFIADVTIREDHEDELVITENPVVQGASVTDNSFKAPARLTVEVGYSNSSLASEGDPNYVQDMYAQFLTLQASRQPFEVVTGKRIYDNMLISLLHITTDEATENSLFLTVRMREIILVNTQTVSVPNSSNMATPQNNGASQSTGAQQAQFAGTSSSGTQFNYNGGPFSAGFGQ